MEKDVFVSVVHTKPWNLEREEGQLVIRNMLFDVPDRSQPLTEVLARGKS